MADHLLEDGRDQEDEEDNDEATEYVDCGDEEDEEEQASTMEGRVRRGEVDSDRPWSADVIDLNPAQTMHM
jgi:hypothetical protein